MQLASSLSSTFARYFDSDSSTRSGSSVPLSPSLVAQDEDLDKFRTMNRFYFGNKRAVMLPLRSLPQFLSAKNLTKEEIERVLFFFFCFSGISSSSF